MKLLQKIGANSENGSHQVIKADKSEESSHKHEFGRVFVS